MTINMRRATIVLMAFGLAGVAFAGTIYAPTAEQNAEGNSSYNALAPSGVGEQTLELVLSSNFSGPVQLTGLDLRLANSTACPACSAFSTTLDNLTLELATTTRTDTSDSTFQDYLTTNEQTVINGVNVAVSSSDTALGNGTTAFDIHFGFSSPYSYDPASGNLVVWWAVPNTSGIPLNDNMDAESGSSVYRIFGGYFQGGIGSCDCVYQPAGIGDHFGWVIQFDTATGTTTPAPEPATALLLAPGLLVLALRRRGRRLV